MQSGLFKQGRYHDWECKIKSKMMQMDRSLRRLVIQKFEPLESLNYDDSYNSEEDGECSDQESTEDGGSSGKNDDSSSQNDASGEEDEEQEDEEEVQDDENKEHEDLEYGPPESEGWVLEVKNF